MSSDRSSDNESAQHCQKSRRKLTRSKYTDIMIKVDEDIYHLDRLKLALMSDYFENLFTTNFAEKSQKLIEIPIVDSETFGKIIDIIHGEDFESVFNVDNYVLMLKAMDYFQVQMKIDSDSFSKFVREKLEKNETVDMKIFEAYRFIIESGNYKHLLSVLFGYISKHLEEVLVQDEISQISLDHFIEILEHYDLPWNIEQRRIVSEICAKWIHHDLENRLVHMLKLLNAARKGLGFRCEVNEEDIRRYLSNTSERSTYETTRRYFFKLLAYGSVVHRQHILSTPEDPSDSDSKGDECELKKVSHSNVREHRSYEEKLREYLENGTLYDIVVKVGDKIYKLHRSILQSKTSYFEEICSAENDETYAQYPENTQNLPNNDRVYLIEGIDQEIFDSLIHFIYFQDTVEYDNIATHLKAVDLLKITELQESFKGSIKKFLSEDVIFCESISTEEIVDLLHYIDKKKGYENLYVAYLCRHLRCKWPSIGNMEQFCSISCDLLEDVISSRKFYMDDPDHMLDICSTWIMHDVQNRYSFIPRLALAIKQFSGLDYDNYEIEAATDFEICSQQVVRDRLLKIVSSISLFPSDTFPDEETGKRNMPVFITSTSGQTFNILNENFESIATLDFPFAFENGGTWVTAAAIDDNVFIYCSAGFRVYNIYSKSFFSLSEDDRFTFGNIVNCGGEIYYSDELMGGFFKYCPALNRWKTFLTLDSKNFERPKHDIMVTSDGEKLYRMHRRYDVPKTEDANGLNLNYTIEMYSFEQKGWICLPHIPKSLLGDDYICGDGVVSLTIINGSDIAVLCKYKLLWFHRNSQKWRKISFLQVEYWSSTLCSVPSSIIARGVDGILHVFNHKLYQLSAANHFWEFKKELPDEFKRKSDKKYYGNIVAIHRPVVRHN